MTGKKERGKESGGAEERRSGGAEERRSGGAEERRSGGAEERRSGEWREESVKRRCGDLSPKPQTIEWRERKRARLRI
jgi:hypothetical protein